MTQFTMRLADRKKNALETVLADLYKKYEAAYAQLLTELDAVNKITIQNHIKDLEQQVHAAEQELASFEAAPGTSQQSKLGIQEHLHKIDFQEALALFEEILAHFGDTGGAAAFLVQDCAALGGEWFVKHLKSVLQEKTANFKACSIECSVETSPDEFGLLTRLAGYFGIPSPPENWEQGARTILDTLCASVRTGDIVFLEFHRWDYLAAQEHVLLKFLTHFWVPLVRQLPRMAQECGRVKVIALITTGGRLAPQCLAAPVFATHDQFFA